MNPRRCGWDESALFDYMDEALSPGRARSFEEHLQGCALCSSDLRAYRNLEEGLENLPTFEPRSDFNDVILEAVSGASVPAGAQPASEKTAGWLRAALSRRGSPARMAIGALASAAVFLAIIGLAGTSGWHGLAAQAVSGLARGIGDLLSSGVGRLLTAIRISDVFLNLAGTFETLYRSAAVAFHAVSAEFWLFSALLSLLALMGAVRLATGSAVERGIGRVRFVF